MIAMRCSRCGSRECGRDAVARWDEEKQDWVLGSVHDSTWCDNCQTDDPGLDEIQITDIKVPALDPKDIEGTILPTTDRGRMFVCLSNAAGKFVTLNSLDETPPAFLRARMEDGYMVDVYRIVSSTTMASVFTLALLSGSKGSKGSMPHPSFALANLVSAHEIERVELGNVL